MLIPIVAATSFSGTNDLIYFGSPFLSCWSLIPYVCSKIESLLDLLLHCESRWHSAESMNFPVVSHRKLSSEQVPVNTSHRQYYSPGLLALSSQVPSADGDLLALQEIFLLSKISWRSSCSPGPERLNDCRIGLQIDFFLQSRGTFIQI